MIASLCTSGLLAASLLLGGVPVAHAEVSKCDLRNALEGDGSQAWDESQDLPSLLATLEAETEADQDSSDGDPSTAALGFTDSADLTARVAGAPRARGTATTTAAGDRTSRSSRGPPLG